MITGFQEPGGPLVVDAYGSASTATAVDPAELPRPRLMWEADTVTAAQGPFAVLGERAIGALSIRDLASGMVMASTKPPSETCGSPPHSGWLQADGPRVLIMSANGDLCLWDISSGEPASPLAGTDADPKPQATHVAVARSAPVAATYDAASRTVSIWDMQARALRATLAVGEVAALALGSRGDRLAIVDQQMELAVLSTGSGGELARVRLSGPSQPQRRAIGLAMAPDGQAIAVNRRTHVELWHLPMEENQLAKDGLRLKAVLLLPVTAGFECLVPVAFSADGSRLAAGYDSAVVWDSTTRREVFRLVSDAEGKIGGAPSWIDEGFALSADGDAIFTTHGVWDVPDPASAPRR